MAKKKRPGAKKVSGTQSRTQQVHLTPGVYLDLIDDAEFLEGKWRDQAMCIEAVSSGQADAMDWFPTAFPGSRDYVPRQVRQICESCPVRVECLVYALSTGEDSGIWAGRSEKELAKIRRRLRTALTAHFTKRT